MDNDAISILASVYESTLRYQGAAKQMSLAFTLFSFLQQAFQTCNIVRFAYDTLSVCFVRNCNAWELTVNVSKHMSEMLQNTL
jgi:hypothetical protein